MLRRMILKSDIAGKRSKYPHFMWVTGFLNPAMGFVLIYIWVPATNLLVADVWDEYRR